MNRFTRIILLVLTVFAVGVGVAYGMVGVPEIDPTMVSGALALLTCGVLILGSRFTRK